MRKRNCKCGMEVAAKVVGVIFAASPVIAGIAGIAWIVATKGWQEFLGFLLFMLVPMGAMVFGFWLITWNCPRKESK